MLEQTVKSHYCSYHFKQIRKNGAQRIYRLNQSYFAGKYKSQNPSLLEFSVHEYTVSHRCSLELEDGTLKYNHL